MSWNGQASSGAHGASSSRDSPSLDPPAVDPRGLRRADLYLLALLLLLAGIHGKLFFDFSRPPFEDAAMLMRYAQHIAGGHGIVWNIGEPPIDGATDFLFLLALAGLAQAGLRLEFAAQLLGVLSHAGTVLLVYLGVVRFFHVGRMLAFASAAVVIVGPGLRYVEVQFGTPFFAFWACLTWFLALESVTRAPTGRLGAGFAVSAFCLGLARPEGVFLALLQLAAVVYARGGRAARPMLAAFAAVFLLLGGAYLAWRSQYFGALLPNPFYAKGGGRLHPDSLIRAVRNAATLTLPFLPVLAYAVTASAYSFVRAWNRRSAATLLRGTGGALALVLALACVHASDPGMHETLVLGRYSPAYATLLGALLVGSLAAYLGAIRVARAGEPGSRPAAGPVAVPNETMAALRRWTAVTLIPLVGFTGIWVLIEDVMNFLMRFQYAVFPMVAMIWPALLSGPAWRRLGWLAGARPRRVVALAALTWVVVLAGAQRSMMTAIDTHADGRYDVGRMLEEYADLGYTMATTEAGLLPYYSRWNAIDLWGFNDRWIARHVQVTEEYLDRYRPELIVMATRYPLNAPEDAAPGSWYGVLGTVERYARENEYALAAAFGATTEKVHYYFVRPECRHAEEITRRLRSFEYIWYMNGERASDFASPEE